MTSPSDEPFDHVMIDIETMSLHPHKALILSVGMIEFDPSSLAGLRIGASRLIILSIEQQLAIGRRVDIGTQEFWAKQSPSAREHWLDYTGERRSLCGTLEDIRKFCDGRGRVWANGTQFDLSNIIGLAEDVKYADPMWHYQTPRDMRTFCRENPATRLIPVTDAPVDIRGVAHEPVYDCIVQAEQVWSHWRNE